MHKRQPQRLLVKEIQKCGFPLTISCQLTLPYCSKAKPNSKRKTGKCTVKETPQKFEALEVSPSVLTQFVATQRSKLTHNFFFQSAKHVR
jgi:hypothetical protein